MTLVEGALASAILAGILLAGIVVAASAIDSTSTAAEISANAAEEARKQTSVEKVLIGAGWSTLEGIPAGGFVPEPLLGDVPYDNLRFRKAVSYSGGQVIYDPPAGEPAYEIRFELTQQDGEGRIVLDEGKETPSILMSGVTGLEFVKSGKVLSVTISGSGDEKKANEGSTTLSCSVLLRSQ